MTGELRLANVGTSMLIGPKSLHPAQTGKPTRSCPKHAHGELKRDFHAIINANNYGLAMKTYKFFVSKWSSLYPSVARSLEEAGTDLLIFYRFPKPMWRGLRTTNSLENLNRECRRRTKTQRSFSTEAATLTLFYGFVAFGQITMRRVTGHQHVASLLQLAEGAA